MVPSMSHPKAPEICNQCAKGRLNVKSPIHTTHTATTASAKRYKMDESLPRLFEFKGVLDKYSY